MATAGRAKRSRVWEHVELELQRKLGPADLAVRVDDINYLIAAPSAQGFAAQALCLSVLQDVLKFFLGEIKTGDIAVRTVTELSGGAIVSAPVDLARLPRPGDPPPPEPAVAAAPESAPTTVDALVDHHAPLKDWKPPLAGRTSVIELGLPKEEPFDLTLTVEPVWNLRRNLITSPSWWSAPARPEKAEPAELEEIDVAAFAYAATLLEEHERQGGSLTLHVPVSFSSLAVQHSRLRLLKLTESVREAMRASVLMGYGLDAGVPPSRLIEAAGLVRSLCAGVLGRVRPSRSALAAVKGCGLRALVIEAPLLGLGQGDGSARMKALSRPRTGSVPI